MNAGLGDTLLYNLVIAFLNSVEGMNLLMIDLLFFAKNVTPDRKRIYRICGVFVLVMLVSNLFLYRFWGNIGIYLLLPAVILLCTGNRIYNLIMMLPAFLLFMLLMVFPEQMCIEVFDRRSEDICSIFGLSVYSIVTDILWFLLLSVTERKCAKQGYDLRLKGSELFGFLLYFLFELFALYVLAIFRTSLTQEAMLISGAVVIIISVVLLLIYWKYLILKRRNVQSQQRIMETEAYLSMQLQAAGKEQENQDEMRILRHDLRNHLQVLQELCAGKHYDEALTYASKLSQKPVLTKSLHITGNKAADIVLSLKNEEAQKHGISLRCEGSFGMLERLEQVDVCTILSNLLDNALEAARGIPNGEIMMRCVERKNYITLIITNPVKEDVRIVNNRIPTIKADTEKHGFGLSAVMRIAKKYHGECLLTCSGGVFTAKVILLV